ncbi:MAG: hypothetical protein ACKO2L_12220 [Planctomycetaceae bacterium]
MLSPLIEETARQGMVIKELERGLFGGFLSAGRQVIDQFLVAQIEPRRQSPAAGTLPDWPCNLHGGVLWSDSEVPFSARLTCRFWSAKIGLCSGQPQHEPRRFHRYKD